jgi:hypothetical protein
MNSDKVVELQNFLNPEGKANWVSMLWTDWNNQRAPQISRWAELHKFLFATDTTETMPPHTRWSNTTTTPKLCQIRDNLHSNYLSALFPNDKWLQWQAYTRESAAKEKASAVRTYMENKTREGGFRNTASRLLLDYIDYGNAFAISSFESRYNVDKDDAIIPDFIGPKMERISPLDIVFNPLAATFENSPKIIRSIKTIGELKVLAETSPEHSFWKQVVERRLQARARFGGYSIDDWSKASQLSIDGYGNMQQYYQSDFVEILEFFGDTHDQDGNLMMNRMVTVADRCVVARDEKINTFSGRAPIRHVGWRKRPDNLWCMGPLDNLVGMQYRIDLLENLKADALDLLVNPPLVIKGEVEQFSYGPRAEIHTDENGDVTELGRGLNGIMAANNDIELLESRMEMYAGAPREAMGIRTPGEKTAFEVGQLNTAAGRIFQEKVTTFEVELLEKTLNDMLEQAVRNMSETDIIRTLDTDLGVVKFREVSVDDITAKGIIRPVGARHFAQQAQDLQNLMGIFTSPIGQMVLPHTSSKNLTKFIEDSVAIAGYEIFKPNVAVFEQQETQRLISQAQEDGMVEEGTTPEDEIVAAPQEASMDEGEGFENISM